MTPPMPVATASGPTRRSITVRVVPRPPTGHTFIARIRVAWNKWDDFGKRAEAQGTDRSKVVNAFIDWYMHVPGAKRPQRPDAPPQDD